MVLLLRPRIRKEAMARTKKKARKDAVSPDPDDSTRVTSPLHIDVVAAEPDWSLKPVSELVGTEVEWSSITADSRLTGGHKMKVCIFCGYRYTGGPNHIRQHLDASIRPRNASMLGRPP